MKEVPLQNRSRSWSPQTKLAPFSNCSTARWATHRRLLQIPNRPPLFEAETVPNKSNENAINGRQGRWIHAVALQQQAPIRTELIPISLVWCEWEYFCYNPLPRRDSSLSLGYPQKLVAGTHLDVQVGSDDVGSLVFHHNTLKLL